MDRKDIGRFLSVVARLKPGVTVAQAQSQMNAIAARIAEEYPDFNGYWGANVVLVRDQISGELRPALLILFGAVAFVLLIACANVSSLLLARASAREREIAVRTAMGASPWRIASQLLTEIVVLALIGGAIGVGLAIWGTDLCSPRVRRIFDLYSIPSIGVSCLCRGSHVDRWLAAWLPLSPFARIRKFQRRSNKAAAVRPVETETLRAERVRGGPNLPRACAVGRFRLLIRSFIQLVGGIRVLTPATCSLQSVTSLEVQTDPRSCFLPAACGIYAFLARSASMDSFPPLLGLVHKPVFTPQPAAAIVDGSSGPTSALSGLTISPRCKYSLAYGATFDARVSRRSYVVIINCRFGPIPTRGSASGR